MRKQNTMTFVNLPVVPIFWHYPGTIKRDRERIVLLFAFVGWRHTSPVQTCGRE